MEMTEVMTMLMGLLGFAIPSGVMWHVWNMRQSFTELQKDVHQILAASEAMKRKMEDNELRDK